jgi:hypothetical protein
MRQKVSLWRITKICILVHKNALFLMLMSCDMWCLVFW